MSLHIRFLACLAAFFGTLAFAGCSSPSVPRATTASGIGLDAADLSAMQTEDRSAGKCVPAGSVRNCEKYELAAFAPELERISGGKIAGQLTPTLNVAGATASFANKAEFHHWLAHYGATTMVRGLELWSPIFHRNHQERAAACFTIADDSLRAATAARWGIYLGTDSQGRPILTETCEGW